MIFYEKQIELTTERLVLRPLRLSDAKILADHLQDPRIGNNAWHLEEPFTEQHMAEFIEREKADMNWLFLAITTKNDDAIGVFDAFFYAENKVAEIGYWLGSKFWGKGYATEAAEGFINYVFNDMKLNKLEATVFPSNRASTHVLEKLGMVQEGYRKNHIFHSGEFFDIIEFGLLRSEYEQQHSIKKK
ncbi:putative gnat family [Anaeramoeba ignava]|uniref:Gnat family n=1 Tax=Anaeramoeba ignava TaxID=1746090 RepID=A0A9Q0LNT0_ANAIG|nr:putative gnat family [Anaeramoeba ignava]